jgi:large subunit ribosomal protein L29
MANARAADLRGLSDEDLDRHINDAYRGYFRHRFEHASRKLENYRVLREDRKTIARLRTIKRQRELARARAQQEKE